MSICALQQAVERHSTYEERMQAAIAAMQDSYPLVSQAVETSFAAKLVLHTQRAVVARLLHAGELTEVDAAVLTDGIDRHLKALYYMPLQNLSAARSDADTLLALPCLRALSFKAAPQPNIFSSRFSAERRATAKGRHTAGEVHLPGAAEGTPGLVDELLGKTTRRSFLPLDVVLSTQSISDISERKTCRASTYGRVRFSHAGRRVSKLATFLGGGRASAIGRVPGTARSAHSDSDASSTRSGPMSGRPLEQHMSTHPIVKS